MDGARPAPRSPEPQSQAAEAPKPQEPQAPGPQEPRRIDRIALHAMPGHLLRRAQQRAVDLFVQAVGECGLRPPQFALLLAAYRNPDANQSELVRITGIDRSTAADLITRLAGRGLIRRLRTRADGRANRLRVTARGVAALEAAAERVERAQAAIVAPVPPGERAQFLKTLSLIADLPDGPAGAPGTPRDALPDETNREGG